MFSSLISAILDTWLVLSNLAFLIPAKRVWEYARYTRAPLYFLIVFFSGSYHTCRSYGNLCIFSFKMHQMLDFFFAELTIPLSALYLIWFPLRYQWVERLLIIAFAILIFVLQVYTDGDLVVQLVIVAISFTLVLAYWIYMRYFTRRAALPPYSVVYFERGIALTALSVGLFGTQGRFMEGYWAIHSVWHVLGALGQDYIIRTRPPADPLASVDARIGSRVGSKRFVKSVPFLL